MPITSATKDLLRERLAAKPIIDILAGHDAGPAVEPYVSALSAAGDTYRGEQGIPGRHFFRRGDPRAWHIHLVERSG